MQGESGENNVRKVAVVGLGLIGGSFEKASRRAGYEVATLHHGDGGAGLADADLVLVCLPPAAVVPWMRDHAGEIRRGAFVVDIAGVKRRIMDEFAAAFPNGTGGWSFIGGHPMAGREVSGYANSLATLFDGASMILVPPDAAASAPPALEHYFLSLGFARVVVTSAAHHDEMIAFTSQLCHIISSAYVREPLARDHVGYSAGSFRDMARVGAPDPDTWTELFLSNRDALLPILERYISRMEDFREALAANDGKRLHKALEDGVVAKSYFGGGIR